MEHMYKSRVAAHEKKAPAAPWPLLAAFGHAELSNSREIRAKRLQKKENRPRFFQRRQNVANFHRRGAGVAAPDGLDLAAPLGGAAGFSGRAEGEPFWVGAGLQTGANAKSTGLETDATDVIRATRIPGAPREPGCTQF